MTTKRWALILIVAFLTLSLALAACGRWGLDGAPAPSDIKPSIPTTPTPVPAPTLQAPPLTILARGEGVTVLEYEGVGFRCLIAAGGSNMDMVCQNSATVPVQPTPDTPDKQQTPAPGPRGQCGRIPPSRGWNARSDGLR